jgi:hypothetical protein
MDRLDKRIRQESVSHTRVPFDVVRQCSEALNRESPMGSLSQEPQEQMHTRVQQEHDQTMEPSQSQPDRSSIERLAQAFVEAVRDNKKLQSITLTEPAYQEVKQHLKEMDEKGVIDHNLYNKARIKAYNAIDKEKARRKAYNASEKGKEAQKHYSTSDKRKEAQKRYDSGEKGKETQKRHSASDKRKETKKRYIKSEKGKEAQKRYSDKLKNPDQNLERLQRKIQRDTEKYSRKEQELKQQIEYALASQQATPELQHLHQQKQILEQGWSTCQKRNHDALQKALALVQIYREVSAFVEPCQSAPAHQEFAEMQQQQAWSLGEEPDDATFENNERFREICNQYLSSFESSPGGSHQQELTLTDPSAVLPSAFERLVTDYHRVNQQLEVYLGSEDEQLEVYLQEFANPESLQQGNTLEF